MIDNEEQAILAEVLKGIVSQVPGNALTITADNADQVATGLIQVLDFHGWCLTYDQDKTRANIARITENYAQRMRSAPMGQPVLPPERLDA